ncbi:hypothetical protein WDW37_11300 [Bdellovibrionota bacterium FG-1]
MTRLMTRMVTCVIVFAMSLIWASSLWAKPNYRKELGMKSCTECHNRENIKQHTTKPYFLKAQEMRTSLRKQEGKFKGKTTCYDCHEGEKIGS